MPGTCHVNPYIFSAAIPQELFSFGPPPHKLIYCYLFCAHPQVSCHIHNWYTSTLYIVTFLIPSHSPHPHLSALYSYFFAQTRLVRSFFLAHVKSPFSHPQSSKQSSIHLQLSISLPPKYGQTFPSSQIANKRKLCDGTLLIIYTHRAVMLGVRSSLSISCCSSWWL